MGEVWNVIMSQLLSPAILFFVVGLLAILVRSDLEVPPAMTTAMTIFLLAGICLEGGMEIVDAIRAKPEIIGVVAILAILATIAGIFIAWFMATAMKKFVKMKTSDAWAVAGLYGGVSTATFIFATDFAAAAGEAAPWMGAVINPFKDASGVIAAVILGRIALAKEALARDGAVETNKRPEIGKLVHEGFTGMAIWIMITTFIVGIIATIWSPKEMEDAMAFFDGMFDGVLCLFLLEMGLAAGRQIKALWGFGAGLLKIMGCAFVLPTIFGCLSILAAYLVNLAVPGILGWGDALVFASIIGSASFISAPPVMRASFPEANPSIYLPMSLALTFPFILLVSVPFIWMPMGMALWGM
jgi:hypothetical protein